MILLLKNGSLLIMLLMCFVINIECACLDRDDPNYETAKQTDSSTFSDLITNIGCSIQSGAKRVKDGVEGGYKYIKDKISTTMDESNARDHEHRPINPAGDAVIEGNGEIYKHIRESVPLVTKPNVTIDDRNAITAPIACPPYTKYVNGICEKVITDFE